MQKGNTYKFLYVVSIFLVLGFIIRLCCDYIIYDNSISFYFYIIERVLEFIIPSVILFIVARIMKKKYNK